MDPGRPTTMPESQHRHLPTRYGARFVSCVRDVPKAQCTQSHIGGHATLQPALSTVFARVRIVGGTRASRKNLRGIPDETSFHVGYTRHYRPSFNVYILRLQEMPWRPAA